MHKVVGVPGAESAIPSPVFCSCALSNARQRDNCNVDSHITAMHQSAAAPAASAAYRRRNAAYLFQPDGKVRGFTHSQAN